RVPVSRSPWPALRRAPLLISLAMTAFSALVFPINVWKMPRLSRPRRPDPPSWPRVSVVIPARHEERGIEAGVGSQLDQEYPDFEVLVVDDRSTDGTRAILDSLARHEPRLRILTGVEPPDGWLGGSRAVQQRSG